MSLTHVSDSTYHATCTIRALSAGFCPHRKDYLRGTIPVGDSSN
jgi:hypothetical protein